MVCMKMSSFVVFCCVLVALAQNIAASPAPNKNAHLQGVVEDFINITINSLLDGLDDPLKVPSLFERYNNVLLTGWLNVSHLELVGFSSIVAKSIDVEYHALTPSSVNLTLEIGGLSLFFDYEASLLLGQLLPYFALGNLSANLDSLVINLFTLADVSLVPTNISNFQNASVDFSVGKNTWLHVEGIYKSDDISKDVNEFLDILIARVIDFVDYNHERISRIISPILQEILDAIFNQKSEEEY
ncbi:uncharacterized protein LOC109541229 [Dendroctonus ponderosae]